MFKRRTIGRILVQTGSDDDDSTARPAKKNRDEHFAELRATAGTAGRPAVDQVHDAQAHAGSPADEAAVAGIGSPLDEDWGCADVRVPEPQRARSRVTRNDNEQGAWAEAYPRESAHSFTWAATGGVTLGEELTERLQHEFSRRVSRCLAETCPTCPACGLKAAPDASVWAAVGTGVSKAGSSGAGSGGAASRGTGGASAGDDTGGAAGGGAESGGRGDTAAGGDAVSSEADGGRGGSSGAGSTAGKPEGVWYVTQQGSAHVPLPVYACRQCGAERRIDPAEVGCFPSTPTRPTAWFDTLLLLHVHNLRMENPTAATAFSKALQRDHAAIGHQTPARVLQAVATAAGHWARVNEMRDSTLVSETALGIGPAGRWADCPACSRCCVAISGDSCMGLRRFKAAAGSSMQLTPLSTGDLFVAENVVVERLEQRQKLARADAGVQLEAAACSEFKAAKESSSRTAHYDRMGIAAFVCRHGFVVSMASLMTPENFVYYELLLEAAAAKLDLEELKAVFLDVACKFEGYYTRVRAAAAATGSDGEAGEAGPTLPPLSFAIGPWHIKPHKLECRVRYNSRLMEGLGLTFGDLIEHLWADIRRHWYITAYMSPAARQDFLTMLVKHRHIKKEDTLAAQLVTNVQRAVKERKEIDARLADMKPEDITTANPRDEFLQGLAAAASGSGGTSGRPTILGRPPWTRSYLEDLETYYMLKTLKDKTRAAEGNPKLQDALKRLADAEERLTTVERKRRVKRWREGGTEMRQAQAERRACEIVRAEQLASTLAASLAASHTAVQVQGSLEVTKGGREKQRRARGKARKDLLGVLTALEKQLSGGVPAWVTYSVADVQAVVETVTTCAVDGRVQLPWETQSCAVSEAAELVQRRLRCDEECGLAARELADMEELYAHRSRALGEQLGVIESSISTLQGGLNTSSELLSEGVTEIVQRALAGLGPCVVGGLSPASLSGQVAHAVAILRGKATCIRRARERVNKLEEAARKARVEVAAKLTGPDMGAVGGDGAVEDEVEQGTSEEEIGEGATEDASQEEEEESEGEAESQEVSEDQDTYE